MQTWTNSQPTPRLEDWAIAGDAVADAVEAAEFLDVDVDHVARLVVLVATHRLGRLEILQPQQFRSCQHPAHRRRRDGTTLAMCLAVKRWRRSATIRSATAWPVAFGLCLGRDERWAMPARPSVRSAPRPLHDLRRHREFQRCLGLGKGACYDRQRHLLSSNALCRPSVRATSPADQNEDKSCQRRVGPTRRSIG